MTYKVVVPVSGGKDSQACLKLALEQYDSSEVLGLFNDTQFEHPFTYQHIATMRQLYGVQIKVLCSGSVPEQVSRYKRFPGQSRHCTKALKIRPSKHFYRQLADEQGEGFEVWYGVRQKESNAREKRYKERVADEVYDPNEFMGEFPKRLGKQGVSIRLPIIEWTADEVMEFVGHKNLNPLYAHGFDRVGCFPCLAAGKKHQDKAYAFDETGWQHDMIAGQLEEEIGHHDRYGKETAPGCSFCQE